MNKRFSKVVTSLVALLTGLWGLAALAGDHVVITGAGATFPYPVYSQWAYDYQKVTGAELNYQSIGSGGGIKNIKAKTVNFGASDAPLTAKELDEAGLMQFPMIMGGVVPVVNLKGVSANELKLSNDALAKIFLGEITHWDDAAIKADNPSVNLPHKAITVVHRSDGSGTTWIYTNFLSKVSPAWKKKVGNDKAVSWPTGVGGKGNEGVAAYVQKIQGAIGYVEYAYALQNKMASVQLKNQAGHYVAPTSENFQAAAANADWQHAPGFYMVLTDQPGDKSWPITGASFILLHKTQTDAAQCREVLKFFQWSYANGASAAEKLDYVAIPESVVKLVESTWATVLKDTSGKAVWTN